MSKNVNKLNKVYQNEQSCLPQAQNAQRNTLCLVQKFVLRILLKFLVSPSNRDLDYLYVAR